MCCRSFNCPDPPLWDQLNESLLPDFIWTDVLALKTDLGSGCYCELLLSSSNFCVCIFIFAPINLKPSGTIDSSSSAKINSKAHTETPESFCHNTTFSHSVVFWSLLHVLKNLNLSPPHRFLRQNQPVCSAQLLDFAGINTVAHKLLCLRTHESRSHSICYGDCALGPRHRRPSCELHTRDPRYITGLRLRHPERSHDFMSLSSATRDYIPHSTAAWEL